MRVLPSRLRARRTRARPTRTSTTRSSRNARPAMTTNPEEGSARPVSGLAILDKPAGWTSHQVVGRIRRLAGTRKVGHAGTLDPMATGVLIVGVEKATRLLGYLALSDKAYEATIRLGISTITDDAEGEVIATVGGAADLDDADIEAAMAKLRGDILQVPAAVSAIKINGVRSYRRVRDGEAVELSERPAGIRTFDLFGRLDMQGDGGGGVDVRAVAGRTAGASIS